MNAITGGREVYGFPKHPELATIVHSYGEVDGEKNAWNFECNH